MSQYFKTDKNQLLFLRLSEWNGFNWYWNKVLEKGLDYAPIQKKINQPELRKDFEEFCSRMRLKLDFRNEPTTYFKEKKFLLLRRLGNHLKAILTH